MSLRGVAQSTLEIVAAGRYVAPSGRVVDIAEDVRTAVAGTRVLDPASLEALLARAGPDGGDRPSIEVSGERTQEAIQRLAGDEGVTDLVALNFASARNPGGGFLNGAKAQEEDLARCSALYACIEPQRLYYTANRAEESLLYTDHLIHSPNVPFFRRTNRDLVEAAALASVITAPAPNAGQALRRDPGAGPAIEAALRRRAGLVLALAEAHEHRTLLLGAWGCGVFQNVPAQVADAFGAWLEGPRFRASFARVVFAVFDRSPRQATLGAFARRFT